jgi:hypothetical protein
MTGWSFVASYRQYNPPFHGARHEKETLTRRRSYRGGGRRRDDDHAIRSRLRGRSSSELRRASPELRMPHGNKKLSTCDRDAIRNWIRQGAKNN